MVGVGSWVCSGTSFSADWVVVTRLRLARQRLHLQKHAKEHSVPVTWTLLMLAAAALLIPRQH